MNTIAVNQTKAVIILPYIPGIIRAPHDKRSRRDIEILKAWNLKYQKDDIHINLINITNLIFHDIHYQMAHTIGGTSQPGVSMKLIISMNGILSARLR